MELVKYINGNTTVTINQDGTKIREYEGRPYVVHPESIDVKITNYCDMGCAFCHESSTTEGKHGDLNKLLEVLKDLPAGIELAIGGGNPLSHPELVPFLQKLKERCFIPNITVNQGHIKRYHDLIVHLIKNNLIYGLGISINNKNYKMLIPLMKESNNIVYHLIMGVNAPNDIQSIIDINSNAKFLLLGYKVFGFGEQYFNDSINYNIINWRKTMRSLLTNVHLSFDNLAIKQLNLKSFFTKEGWDRFYMGDDFVYTMYVDAVNQEYAPTSRSKNRSLFSECSLLEYFKINKKFIL